MAAVLPHISPIVAAGHFAGSPYGDGLLFLSPAVSGEVSPENHVLPGSSQHPRDISFAIARLRS